MLRILALKIVPLDGHDLSDLPRQGRTHCRNELLIHFQADAASLPYA